MTDISARTKGVPSVPCGRCNGTSYACGVGLTTAAGCCSGLVSAKAPCPDCSGTGLARRSGLAEAGNNLAKRCAAIMPQWGSGMHTGEFLIIDDNHDGTVTVIISTFETHNAVWDDLSTDGLLPILTSPSTLGWLLLFARNAQRNPHLTAEFQPAHSSRPPGWYLLTDYGTIGPKETEAELYIVAMESAEELGLTARSASEKHHANG